MEKDFSDFSKEYDHSPNRSSGLLIYANLMGLFCAFLTMIFVTKNLGSPLNQKNSFGTSIEKFNVDEGSIGQNKNNSDGNSKELIKKIEEQKKLIETLAAQAEKVQNEANIHKSKILEVGQETRHLSEGKRALEGEINSQKEEIQKLNELLVKEKIEKDKLIDRIRQEQEQKTAEQVLRDKKEQEIVRKESQLRSRDSMLSQSHQNMEYSRTIIENQEAEIAQLRAQLNEYRNQVDSLPQNLMIVLKWSAAVDLDLAVIDPKGQRFDYKKRSIAGVDGKLTVEAKTGPGSEIWQAGNFMPGTYRVIISFNPGPVGSKPDANFVIQASTSRDSKESLSHIIDVSRKTKEMKVIVSENGGIRFN